MSDDDGSVVRYATAEDLPTWRALRLRSLAESPDAFGSTLEREQGFCEADWRGRFNPPAVLAFAGPEGEGAGAARAGLAAAEPVGLGGGYEVSPGVLHVVAMWVDPRWRGRGLSRRILDLVVDWARVQDLEVRLQVTGGNAAARAAYESYGFAPTGITMALREGSDLQAAELALPASSQRSSRARPVGRSRPADQ